MALASRLPATADLTDEELITRARMRDDRAVRELLDRYRSVVWGMARGLFLPGGTHEDLVQEGMLGLCAAMLSYKPGGVASFRTFASTCIKRKLYGAITSATRRKHQVLTKTVRGVDEGDPSYLASDEWNPELIVLQHDERDRRMASFESLTVYEASVLALYLEGKTHKAIADQLGRDPKSIDNALVRVRHKVQRYASHLPS